MTQFDTDLSPHCLTSFCVIAYRISLELMTLNPVCENVETSEGVPVTVTGVAQVKIMTSPDILALACEQFLGKDVQYIKTVILQTLEGHLRAILGMSLCFVFYSLSSLSLFSFYSPSPLSFLAFFSFFSFFFYPCSFFFSSSSFFSFYSFSSCSFSFYFFYFSCSCSFSYFKFSFSLSFSLSPPSYPLLLCLILFISSLGQHSIHILARWLTTK